MTPRRRFIKALELEEPDRVPMFELEFQIPELFIGKRMILDEEYDYMVKRGKIKELTEHNVEILIKICRALGYDGIRLYAVPDIVYAIRIVKKKAPELAIIGSADGTLSIPGSWRDFIELTREMRLKRSELKNKLLSRIKVEIERAKEQIEAGADIIVGCADYCTNAGPFLSPKDFEDLVFPYLRTLVNAIHRSGAFFIKHTDGNLWPIIDGLVNTGIDALHSIDPVAGMDLGRLKEKYGDRICLCGNVDIGLLQLGNPHEVVEAVKKCLRAAAHGGGYVLSTSNVIQKEHKKENVLAMIKAAKKYGVYPLRDK